MAKRIQKSNTTGAAGADYVQATFVELGWGAIPVPQEHDIGTDLLLCPRDSRRFDLGAIMGAQVKTGPSYFQSKVLNPDKTIKGWWFDTDEDHKNYWCDHSDPHIAVLHDLDSKISYWAHLNHKDFVTTGAGWKIFVSSSAKVDTENLDKLREIAIGGSKTRNWEGSSWTQGHSIPKDAQLRYALVTPRIIAPHPNSGIQDLNPYQAIAKIIQLRFQNLKYSRDNINVLSPKRLSEAPMWEWRLYSALYHWIAYDDNTSITQCADSATTSEQKVAATICTAFSYFEEGQIDKAINLLEEEIEKDDASPVDHAWLLAHLAQCNSKIENTDQSKEQALSAYSIQNERATDPTAHAIAAGASYLIFMADDVIGENLEKAIESNDVVSSWWRSQTLVAGLGRQFDELFEQWVDDSNKTNYTQDEAWCSFRSSMLQSGLSANTPSWAYAASLLARRILITSTDEEKIAEGIKILMLSGKSKILEKALRKLLRFGPISSILIASSNLDLTCSSKLSISDICFIETSADALTEVDCNRYAKFAVGILRRNLNKENYSLLKMLGALIPRCNPSTICEIIDYIVALPLIDSSLIGRPLGIIIEQIPIDSWTKNDIEALRARDPDEQELKREIDELLAKNDPIFRSGLVEKIEAGDIDALSSYGNIIGLPIVAASGMIRHLSTSVEAQVTSANNNTGQTLDGGRDLTNLIKLNHYHPNVACWDPVVSAIESKMRDSRKITAIRLLTILSHDLPIELRDSLRPSLQAISQKVRTATPLDSFEGTPVLNGHAQVALNSFFPDEIKLKDIHLQLRESEPEKRAAAIQALVAHSEIDLDHLSILTATTRDNSKVVRRAAVFGIASWVCTNKAMPDSLEVIKGLLDKGGPEIGVWASNACLIRGQDQASTVLLKKLLINHPLASIRNKATMTEKQQPH